MRERKAKMKREEEKVGLRKKDSERGKEKERGKKKKDKGSCIKV